MSARFTLTTHSPEETERLGSRLGSQLASGDVICLAGTLGAGKTCLIRGMVRGWGALERPTSPTFTLINEYHREGEVNRFYHLDCYRLSGQADALSTGLEDVLASKGIIAIEWPERIEALLPSERLWIDLQAHGEMERELRFTAGGQRGGALLAALIAAVD